MQLCSTPFYNRAVIDTTKLTSLLNNVFVNAKQILEVANFSIANTLHGSSRGNIVSIHPGCNTSQSESGCMCKKGCSSVLLHLFQHR